MIFSKTLSMLPIVIGVNTHVDTYHRSELLYTDDYVQNNLAHDIQEVYQVQKQIDTVLGDMVFNEVLFANLLLKWKKQTMFLSSADQILANENFKGIVNMSYSAVPFIMNEISAKPSTLVWALNLIYGHRITHKDVSIQEASVLWLKWWKSVNYSENN